VYLEAKVAIIRYRNIYGSSYMEQTFSRDFFVLCIKNDTENSFRHIYSRLKILTEGTASRTIWLWSQIGIHYIVGTSPSRDMIEKKMLALD
jgi:hypothetical protein